MGGDQCLVGGRVGRLGEREDSEAGRGGGEKGGREGFPNADSQKPALTHSWGWALGRDAAPFLSAASRSGSV